MIQAYSEMRLVMITIIFTSVLTLVYMSVAAIPWGLERNNGYGIIPTYAVGSVDGNTYTTMSLYFFVFGVFAEGLLFAFLLDSVRNIKKEFSMMAEMQTFSVVWLVITNFLLFLSI